MKHRAMLSALVLVALSVVASPGFAHWHHPHMFMPRPILPLFGGFLPPLWPRPLLPMPVMIPPPVMVPPVMQPPMIPGGGVVVPSHPHEPFVPGMSRDECINFDFHGVRPSAELKLRIVRTAPGDRKVLYQRALFTMKFDTDANAKSTADWVRTEIERLAQ